jgi:hypothetical protein
LKHAREDYQRIQDPAHLIPEDEPVFLLRGQDKVAPAAVGFWAFMASKEGAKKDIIDAALKQSDAMFDWQKKHNIKVPDLPGEMTNVKITAVKIEAPMNRFIVGALGDMICIGLPFKTARMSKDEALTLASWLVALATTDPAKDFQPLLDAILET